MGEFGDNSELNTHVTLSHVNWKLPSIDITFTAVISVTRMFWGTGTYIEVSSKS